MILETVTRKLPTKDTPVIAIPSSHIERMKARFTAEGKLLHMRTIMHHSGLIQTTGRLFRDQAAFDEWFADPIVQARDHIYQEHYTRNNVASTRTVQTI
jgi:hypothetical protein